jgi:hypothetical protein
MCVLNHTTWTAWTIPIYIKFTLTSCVYVSRFSRILLIGHSNIRVVNGRRQQHTEPELIILSVHVSDKVDHSLVFHLQFDDFNMQFMNDYGIPSLNAISCGSAYDEREDRLYIICECLCFIHLEEKSDKEKKLREWRIDSLPFIKSLVISNISVNMYYAASLVTLS